MLSTVARLRLITRIQSAALLTLVAIACFQPHEFLRAQSPTMAWHDPAHHAVQMIPVESDVQLEMLDWGGKGRPIVLLSGLGNTAHVFDDFAPKLTGEYHVYGITRRGFGISSAPQMGYSADRLGDDVLAVLAALNISGPVLVGHSIAGEELSSIASRHPERIAGAVYLDAAVGFAYYDPSIGELNLDLLNLQKKLRELASQPPEPRPLVHELLRSDLPLFERDLQRFERLFDEMVKSQPPHQGPTAADLASFAALRSWQTRVDHLPFTEAELRQQFEVNPDESVGRRKDRGFVRDGILMGQQKYTTLKVPMMAIYATENGHDVSDQIAAFEAGNPSAPVVRLPHANHYVYLSNEGEVLRAIGDFMRSLPPAP